MAYYVGLMSGTSLDGCDAALIDCAGDETRLVDFLTVPMPDSLRMQVMDCCSLERSNIALVCSLNVELGYWFADAAKALCRQAGVDFSEIAAIGSHGQTVYHIPEAMECLQPSTLQLGEPAVIAYETGVPVVSSMRAMDMAAGGQGAPLVPFSEYLLYRHLAPIALQNIGGIGNVTVLPEKAGPDDVFAFDTGPGNMIIDAMMRHFYQLPYDKGGEQAAAGKVNQALLETWMRVPYIDAPPPKSTGRELFGDQFVKAQLAAHTDIAPADFVATATAFTAHSIQRNYALYVFPKAPGLKRLVLAGGGAHNNTLRAMLSRLMPGIQVQTQEDLGWSSDAKEAVAFALIAKQTMEHKPGNLPSATGASRSVILGSVTWPPERKPQEEHSEDSL